MRKGTWWILCPLLAVACGGEPGESDRPGATGGAGLGGSPGSSGSAGGGTGAVAGLGGSVSGGSSASAGIITTPDESLMARHCDDMNAATCGALVPCCQLDQAQCESMLAESCFQELVSGIGFDPAAAAACIAGVSAVYAGCSVAPTTSPEVQAVRDACQRVWVGLLQTGAPCTTNMQCAAVPGAAVTCVTPGGASSGVCAQVPLLAVGVECGDSDKGACEGGTFCGFSGDAPRCLPVGDEGAACLDMEECRSGLTCLGDVCTAPSMEDICSALRN